MDGDGQGGDGMLTLAMGGWSDLSSSIFLENSALSSARSLANSERRFLISPFISLIKLVNCPSMLVMWLSAAGVALGVVVGACGAITLPGTDSLSSFWLVVFDAFDALLVGVLVWELMIACPRFLKSVAVLLMASSFFCCSVAWAGASTCISMA